MKKIIKSKKIKQKKVNLFESNEYVELITKEKGFPKKLNRSHHVAVKVNNLHKSFKVGKRRLKVLKGINFNIYSGEFVIVYGPSGCGKSTLLHTILGLEEPTKGKVFVRGENIYSLNENQKADFRKQKFGMVFQQSNWIKSLSVIQNVSYPLILQGLSEKDAAVKALSCLKQVGLEHLANNKPTELSGGEQQRVSLARSLTTNPWILVADEPTGNLDTESSIGVMKILTKLNRVDRKVIIMVTHETRFLPLANRLIGLTDGKIIVDEKD